MTVIILSKGWLVLYDFFLLFISFIYDRFVHQFKFEINIFSCNKYYFFGNEKVSMIGSPPIYCFFLIIVLNFY